MSTEFLLITGAVLLACGCAGLLMVRLNNPRLLGVGWLGAALGAGGTGAFLLFASDRLAPLLSAVLADVLVLLALVLLHVAVMEAVGLRGWPRLSLVLLGVQAVVNLVVLYGHPSAPLRIPVIGLLAGVQALETVVLLVRRADCTMRAQARFISFVLIVFAAWNLLRSLALVTGLLGTRSRSGDSAAEQVQTLTFVLYLAVALGLSFGFLWMTTAGLTAELEDLANTDPLTRVLTRRAFTRCFQDQLERSERTGASFALLLLDLDYFKQINDHHGHVVGDEVLSAVAYRMREALVDAETLGRWGGEEFAILLPEAASAQATAQRVRLRIEESIAVCDLTLKIPMTASIGLTLCHAGDSSEDAFRRADEALYRAKSAGRNCVMTAPPQSSPRAAEGSLPLRGSTHRRTGRERSGTEDIQFVGAHR